MGTSAIFLQCIQYLLYRPNTGHDERAYFESSVVIITLILGKYLEASEGQNLRAIRKHGIAAEDGKGRQER